MNIKHHIFLSLSNEVSQICTPLFEFIDITNFDWIRTYADGSKARLTTYPEWVEHYFNQEYYKDSQFERHPSLYKSGFSIWDYIDSSPRYFDKDMEESFKRAHGLSILNVYQDYMDQFMFTTTPDKKEINQCYQRSMEELIKFTQYFMQTATKQIEKSINDRITSLYEYGTFFSPDGSSLLLNEKYNKFLNQITIRELSFLNKHNEINALTKRETECLRYRARGYSIKEIANILNIGEKAVEAHLSKIKTKYGSDIFTKLIRDIRKNMIIKDPHL